MTGALSKTLGSILSLRREGFKIATLAILAALAIGILAGAIIEISKPYIMYVAIICSSIIIASFVVIIRDVTDGLNFEDTIRASVIFDSATGDILRVKDYRYTNELVRVIQAVEAENKAIHSDWGNYPIVGKRESKVAKKDTGLVWYAISKMENDDEPAGEPAPSIKFLEEVTVFLILEDLSIHLSDYFGDKDGDSEIVEMVRNDIPEFLLKNRILSLLSTPIEQRDIFIDAFPDPDKRPKGEIHGIFGSNGAMYKRFDLTLPCKSKIRDLGRDGFAIETPRFNLQISVKYRGTHTAMSDGFTNLYLGKIFSDVQPKDLIITVSGKIKPLSLLNTKGWEYHSWLDSFRARLVHSYGFEAFLETIHWSMIEPLLYASQRVSNGGIRRSAPPTRSVEN